MPKQLGYTLGNIISRQGHEFNVAVYSHADTLLSGTFAGLVVGGTLFMISLVGNIITMSVIVIFWRKVKEYISVQNK